ncbi:MAG: GrpB family protein, partial [Chloroflexi bacterium]
MTRKVEVVPYRSDWPVQFVDEARALQMVFGNQLLSIHHFGSTSIPGVSAKPIIDILLIA